MACATDWSIVCLSVPLSYWCSWSLFISQFSHAKMEQIFFGIPQGLSVEGMELKNGAVITQRYRYRTWKTVTKLAQNTVGTYSCFFFCHFHRPWVTLTLISRQTIHSIIAFVVARFVSNIWLSLLFVVGLQQLDLLLWIVFNYQY